MLKVFIMLITSLCPICFIFNFHKLYKFDKSKDRVIDKRERERERERERRARENVYEREGERNN